VFVRHLRTGATASLRERDVFPAASLAKLPILVEAYRRLGAGTLRAGDLVAITPDSITDGAGVLQARVGEQVSVGELLQLVVTVSDNVAARLLLRLVGGETAVNRTLDELGLTDTRLYADDRPNVTTAADMGALLGWVATQGQGPLAGAATPPVAAGATLDSAPLAQTLPWLLSLPQAQAWIRRDLPRGAVVAHKSGQLPSLRHEAALVYTPRGPFVVVGLTDQLADQADAEDFLSRLANAVYRHFMR
jgi:beta-lactamase class A